MAQKIATKKGLLGYNHQIMKKSSEVKEREFFSIKFIIFGQLILLLIKWCKSCPLLELGMPTLFGV
jgi:hypothetical protein